MTRTLHATNLLELLEKHVFLCMPSVSCAYIKFSGFVKCFKTSYLLMPLSTPSFLPCQSVPLFNHIFSVQQRWWLSGQSSEYFAVVTRQYATRTTVAATYLLTTLKCPCRVVRWDKLWNDFKGIAAKFYGFFLKDFSMMNLALWDQRHEGATRICQGTRRYTPRALTVPSGPVVPPISRCTIHHAEIWLCHELFGFDTLGSRNLQAKFQSGRWRIMHCRKSMRAFL